ncbi:uncharacterized protein LOC104415372 [Eucalyptus grandis]|uniref:uncharacterized protein LOC104415918 n=1 Tax=Eucalyptus grandis TaxID=71139 RepID=UPI0008A0B2AF|nr:uncharacterized protein LOC104415918 [Eucalyptus grandis]XP_039174256.1 uncharacterized protein LOC104415372 [Eucalyptus grandis]
MRGRVGSRFHFFRNRNRRNLGTGNTQTLNLSFSFLSVNNKKREPISPSFFPLVHSCFATLWFFPLLCGSVHLVVLDILFLSATLWFSFESFAITNAGRGSATIIQQLRNIITQVEENIGKFAKKGLTPSQIGVILRDSHGIAQVKSITGSKILRILKAHDYSNI